MNPELIIVGAAVALLFAVPVAMLLWIAAQWAQGRAMARRVALLEQTLSRMAPPPVSPPPVDPARPAPGAVAPAPPPGRHAAGPERDAPASAEDEPSGAPDA